jgi:electron transfer flavoprotein-quinone oxidoreductase
MSSSNFDVLVVGAGAAGLTAAIGLSRAGFAVGVVEAAAFPGAENWSGCVYFCENLAHPDILGPDGVDGLAWERRLVERGFFATDGHGMLGVTYRDPSAFRHCYTVLRPIYDHHMAQVARRHGITILTETTAESLIREDGRVIGVCTNRGPLYADLTFLAEGDASNLVTREGYERFTDEREAPKFLQGIKQVIDMPPGAIEELFGVGAEEGVAYEMLVRNGTLRGKTAQLNAGGFVYTNRRSLSVGLVLPADNLAHFGGDPNLLMEWFEQLPALKPWFGRGTRGVFGAKIIRGGGARDIPTLIDDGLAVGGAASAIGIDFPYPNFTGPATRMGLLITHAAGRIRDEKTRFTRDALRRHYLEPLQRTHYWQDVEFLRRWPGYVKRTKVFFGENIDLALGTAYIWTRPDRWLVTKWINWLRLVREAGGPTRWAEMRQDSRYLARALRVREIADRPSIGRLLLDGTVNALRDLFRRPRANLPESGTIRVHYAVGGGAVASGQPPRPLRRWFRRLSPVLAAAARGVYANDEVPLPDKLPETLRLLVRQVNVLDLLGLGWLALATGFTTALMSAWDRLRGGTRRRRRGSGLYRTYALAAQQALDMTPLTAGAGQNWEARLGRLAYQTAHGSHIHVLWPQVLPQKDQVADAGLWHVCPAHVYEARTNSMGQAQVIVNFENCIKCETCWRTSDIVDWGRDGRQRFVYPVHSSSVTRLLTHTPEPTLAATVRPRATDPWSDLMPSAALLGEVNGRHTDLARRVLRLTDTLDKKLAEFDAALNEEPRIVDQARAEYLEMLTRYAQQLAERINEVLDELGTIEPPRGERARAYDRARRLVNALVSKSQERSRRTWTRKYAWASSEGRQLRWHHLAGLRRLLGGPAHRVGDALPSPDPVDAWLRAERDEQSNADLLRSWRVQLDEVFAPSAWRDLDAGTSLTAAQDSVLRKLIARVPPIDPENLTHTLHPAARKALLAELAGRDPSLAYRVAGHLWARDLASLGSTSGALHEMAGMFARGETWASFSIVDNASSDGQSWAGDAWLVPAQGADWLVLLVGEQLVVVPANAPGIQIEPLATLGLRGAGLARVRLAAFTPRDSAAGADRDRLERACHILSAADLTSIACGMAAKLCARSVAHATSRVQFPGLFHDEEARDTIGKFGIVKKMIADMEAQRCLIETFDHTLSPTDLSPASVERAVLIKAAAAEALGTSPGSLSYNAGQVFGGTGYSEDDILSKFYRDSAAWRVLGMPNAEAYRRRGEALLRSWRGEGQRLATVADEVDLFEEVAQRKALQAELDEVRNARSRIKAVVAEWQEAHTAIDGARAAAAAAEFVEGLARQETHLLASKALILRAHARLEQGLPAEVPIALVRVWLDRAVDALDEFEDRVRRHLHPADQRDDRPVVEVDAGAPITVYADYLRAGVPYDSGDFLLHPVNLVQPRYVPELVRSDPALAAHHREFAEALRDHFSKPRAGLIYERYVEKTHRPDESDLDFCRKHGHFRMPIPKQLGGEGRTKADYYLLTMNAQRLVDVAISLLIQANTSIGTTPVLLARDKDVPKALKEVGAFLADSALRSQIREQIDALRSRVRRGDLAGLADGAAKLQGRLQEAVLGRPSLRSALSSFASAWKKVERAHGEQEVAKLDRLLADLTAAWDKTPASAEAYQDELGRRLRACDLFLRWVSSGQISAFALTEPSAGSDTARVATRAKLCSVQLEEAGDGVYRFVPAAGGAPRTLLDADRLVFDGQVARYRWSDDAEPALIRFDEYDYETDDPRGLRSFERAGRKVHFSDVAQVRRRDGKLWYDYWEMTGAKMWITNGRVSGSMALYAKTEAGVTGFIVDRHAEGLVVGKDEAKMGQLGSPTNELSLEAVRVPRENLLGIEGRGQVNALETLNVGRAGLATSCVAQMTGLIEQSQAVALERHGQVPHWVEWRLARMEEDHFIAAAVAYEVIGRFDHPGTKSVRMESAIAKMLGSELLHEVIELSEEVLGPAGQTQIYLTEKRKRDARILNIYEGTNEIQRSLILKDLAAELAPRWQAATAGRPAHTSREALELESLKEALRQQVNAAVGFFRQALWSNPNLQANCFLLAEAAAWVKAADSTLARVAWLTREEFSGESPTAAEGGTGTSAPDAAAAEGRAAAIALGRRALARCHSEVRERLRRFEEELTHLRRGFYANAVRAAALVFGRSAETTESAPPPVRVTRPLRVLVVFEVLNPGAPQPEVRDGRLLEPYLTLSEADRSALESALRIRDEASAPVRVEVAAVGPRAASQILRTALSLGVDRARLITSVDPVAADSAGEALAAVVATGERFDLILAGQPEGSGEDGLAARLAAERLGVRYAGIARGLGIQAGDSESVATLVDSSGRARASALPCCIGLQAAEELRSFTISGFLQGAARNVEIIRWPKAVRHEVVTFGESAPTAVRVATQELAGPMPAPRAAQEILERMGLSGARVGLPPYDGRIESVAHPVFLEPTTPFTEAVVAVLGSESEGRLLPSANAVLAGARVLAVTLGADLKVLVITPEDEPAQRRALGQVVAEFGGDVVLMAVARAESVPEVRSRLLADCWPEGMHPRAVVGETWATSAFIRLSAGQPAVQRLALGVRRLEAENGKVLLETGRSGGRLRARQTLVADEGEACWVTVLDDAEVADVLFPAGQVRVQRWAPRLERFFGQAEVQQLLEELKKETGLVRLSDAEFIVDVGFGVGNRDGYELVIDPLVAALSRLGIRSLAVGGSRKVTEELHLLAADQQIGQSGVSVNPQILLAIGVSGAPQHMNYIGQRATIVAFNRDPEAPIMVYNRLRPRPRVFPVVGDLFQTVPAFTSALQQESPARPEAPAQVAAAAVSA